jgi:hypothetical protein
VRRMGTNVLRAFEAERGVPRIPLFGFVNWIGRFLLLATAGHGYRPFRALVWLVGLWLLGAGVFEIAFERGALRVAAPPSATQSAISLSPPESLIYDSSFNPWLYSLDVMIPAVDLGQESQWSVTTDFKSVVLPAAKTPSAKEAMAMVEGMGEFGIPAAFVGMAQWIVMEVIAAIGNDALAAVWAWLQAAASWVLLTIAAGGFAGFIKPRETS